jgi:antiviral helicase SKI2
VSHQLLDLPISAITVITGQRLRLEAQLDPVAIGSLVQQLLRLLEASPEGPAAMDPVKDLKIQDIDLVEKSRRRAMLYNKAAQSKCHTCKKLPEQYELMDKQARLRRRMNQLRCAGVCSFSRLSPT